MLRINNIGVVKAVASIAAALALFSCVDDNYDCQSLDPNKNYDVPGYMTVSLHTISHLSTRGEETTTRAADYDDGDDSEYAIANGKYHYLLLYDKSGNTKPAAILSLSDAESSKASAYNITLKVEKAFSANNLSSAIENEEAFKNFLTNKEAFVLLNYKTGSDSPVLTDITKDNLKQLSLSSYSFREGGKEYFLMSNSVYLENQGADNYSKKIDGKIFPDNIFHSESEARQNPAIEVAVERLATKYTVDFSSIATSPNMIDPNDNSDYDEIGDIAVGEDCLFVIRPSSTVNFYDESKGLEFTEDSYIINSLEKTWEIHVLGYDVNGLEKTTGLFRDISAKPYFNSNGSSDGYGWNDPDNRRCYWSEDNHYVINSSTSLYYPDQYRLALETGSIKSYHDTKDGIYSNSIVTNNDNYYLKYITFEDLIGKSGNLYSLENTYDDSGQTLGKEGYFTAGTHLLVGCKLIIHDVNEINTNQDLYRGQNNIFYASESQILQGKLDILNQLILPEGNHGLRILNADWKNHRSIPDSEKEGEYFIEKFDWNKGSVLWIKNGRTEWVATVNDLTLIPAELSGGDGQCLIAPAYTDENSYEFYLAPLTESGDRDLEKSTPISYNQLISLIHKIIGPIDHFKNGYMYYPAVITHNTPVLKTKDGGYSDDELSWKTVGDIGAVRNTWYQLNVKGVNGVGRPISITEQPIIPKMDIKRNYLNVSVNILNWHTITQREVPQSKL